MQKVILDCDPGIDDALAIMMAVNTCDLLGVCTVAGNVAQEFTYHNARNILSFLGHEEIPVYQGAKKPLNKKLVDGSDAHGFDGLDGIKLPASKAKHTSMHAVEFMREMIMSYPNKITLCATGPLTNIALLFTRYPQCVSLIQEIVIMGGALFVSGNVSAAAEFNFKCDPSAVEIVLSADVKKRIIPLDATMQVQLTKQQVEEAYEKKHSENLKWILELLDHRWKVGKQNGFYGYPMHDPLTFGAVLDENVVDVSSYHIIVETCAQAKTEGMIYADMRKHRPFENADVAISANEDRFIQKFLEAVTFK